MRAFSHLHIEELREGVLRFAGDAGSGMQLAGGCFADLCALAGRSFQTWKDFPIEIRTRAGEPAGISSFQIRFARSRVLTSGDEVDVLIAMNPAACLKSLPMVRRGGLVALNADAFTADLMEKAGWPGASQDPLRGFRVLRLPMTVLTRQALEGSPLKIAEKDQCRNFFALGVALRLCGLSARIPPGRFRERLARRSGLAGADEKVLEAGWRHAGEACGAPARPPKFRGDFSRRAPPRRISGNKALVLGLAAASHFSRTKLVYASYPITPASEILNDLALLGPYGIDAFQAEDEIAACGAALGASFAGALGVTGTSGPGMCLKLEMLGLAVAVELPLVVINVQRGGPSTGMPTKPEQADLLQAFFGRHGEAPLAILAPRSSAHCFDMAIEAVRIAVKFMTPVVLLSDAYLASATEIWAPPRGSQIGRIRIGHPRASKGKFLPYLRNRSTLARPWAVPGTPGLEHCLYGVNKFDVTGEVNYDPRRNEELALTRAQKILRVARDIPLIRVNGPDRGRLLVLSWGSTYGAAAEAVGEFGKKGVRVSHAHLDYLNPFPRNLGGVLSHFEKVLVPELNLGQLLFLVRSAYPFVRAQGLNKLQGQPFRVREIVSGIEEALRK